MVGYNALRISYMSLIYTITRTFKPLIGDSVIININYLNIYLVY